MKKLLVNFIKCGTLGWCMEIIFTALDSLRRRDMKLTGHSSLWMFPIYGCAALLQPFFGLFKNRHPLLRGSMYALLIFIGEFAAGSLLTDKELCPWDYNRSRWNIKRVIRLDYIPWWILAGLLFERLLSPGSRPDRKGAGDY